MSFWEIRPIARQVACVEQSGAWTYAELCEHAHQLRRAMTGDRKQLGILQCKNSRTCIAAYLGALQSGSAVLLVSERLAQELLLRLVEEYQPDWIAGAALPGVPGFRLVSTFGDVDLCRASMVPAREIHPELAVLLSTSGSTGSPKLVRLSYANIQANAEQIAEYLGLNAEERPITSLPLQYSYGLSVVNSHLLANATLVVTDHSIAQRPFWDLMEKERVTSFAGVPYMYQTLLRLRLLNKKLPSLRTLTQAGGALGVNLAQQVQALCETHQRSFFIMYGQTEATARIAFVPPDRLKDKFGSIGIPVPRGRLFMDQTNNELVYSGPNVMLGYAQSAADLGKGDELGGRLRTGDLGRVDEEGYFYVSGRLKRFLKIFGQRFSLDELESTLQKRFNVPVACYGYDDGLRVAVEDQRLVQEVAEFVSDTYHLHHSAFAVRSCEAIPQNANGKIDYSALLSAATA